MFVALVVQHEMRVHRNMSSSVARPDIPHFSTLSYKRHDFKKLLNVNVYSDLTTFLSEIFRILRRIFRDIIINVFRSSCEVLNALVRF